jgi:hypothetical protein
MAAVAGVVAAFCLYRQVNSEIRRRVETRLASHYKGLKVKLRAAQLVEGKGIRVFDLSISDPNVEGPSGELLHVEEAVLECSTDWQELIKGDPQVRRVLIRRSTLRSTRLPDGTWSAGKLLPPPHFGDQPPEVSIENGAIEIIDPLKNPASTLALRDMNLTCTPAEESPNPVSLVGENGTIPLSAPAAFNGPGVDANVRRFQGTLAGDGLHRVEFEGWLDVRSTAFSLRGKAEGVEISPELRDSLPESLARKLAPLGDFRAQTELAFQLDYDPTAAVPMQFDVSAQVARGRIDDPRFPQAVTGVRAAVRLNNAGYAIDDLTARSGRTTLRLACRATGFESNSPLALKGEVHQLDLDPTLLRVLPPSLQNLWRHYSPAGCIDIEGQFEYDGRNYRPQFTVKCLDVTFTHYKFPYRLNHGHGSIVLKDDVMKVEMKASSGRQLIDLTAEANGPFSSNPTGWFEAHTSDLQIDEALIAALPPKPREVVRSLDPRGTLAAHVRIWRSRPDEPMHQHVVLNAYDCSIRYEKFPYPLTNVHGTLDMLDHDWTFRNLVGMHNTARVTCEGYLRSIDKIRTGVEPIAAAPAAPAGGDTPVANISPPEPAGQSTELVLNFTGKDVPLEQELRDALVKSSPHIREVWRNLRPLGVVDLTAKVSRLSEDEKSSVAVHIDPQRDATSIEPVHFPYRFDRLQGAIDYRDGHVTFQNCKAEHGPVNAAVKMTTDGYCDFHPDGRWRVCFERLRVDQLRADRDLIQALPDRLKKTVVELNPTGAINLSGSIDLERTGQPNEPLQSRWNVCLGLQQSSIQCGGIPLDNVCGEVPLRGDFDWRRRLPLQSRGELKLDSVTYKDCQFTRVLGPIWIDDGRVLFGGCVDGSDNGAVSGEAVGPLQKPSPLTADLFGGKFYGDGWITLEPTPRYSTNLTLTDASLARCVQDLTGGRQKLRGKILATADLWGTGRTRNSLFGQGSIRLSEGDVYELPVMLSLLKILSIRPPDQNAFSDGTIDYRVVGEHTYFDRIAFHGDAISLRGSGHMNLQSQIDLTFYALVGRGELEIPVIKQVVRAASEQLMLIRVGGTLQSPETRQEALPALNQALQQIRSELENRK